MAGKVRTSDLLVSSLADVDSVEKLTNILMLYLGRLRDLGAGQRDFGDVNA